MFLLWGEKKASEKYEDDRKTKNIEQRKGKKNESLNKRDTLKAYTFKEAFCFKKYMAASMLKPKHKENEVNLVFPLLLDKHVLS